MDNPFQPSLAAFNGAMGASDCIREEPSYEDDVSLELAGLEIQAHNVPSRLHDKVKGSYRDDSLMINEFSPRPQHTIMNSRTGSRKSRLSIEIKDTPGKCVQLEKQLAAVQRAVVEPLQREITLLKTAGPYDETLTSNPELEIVLKVSFGSDSGSPRSSSSRSSAYSGSSGDDSDDDDVKERDHEHLVNQQLRYQIEGELSAMKDSLERNQEWRAFYAYHLERFRQMHNQLTKQYHTKLAHTDRELFYAEQDLARAQRDADANLQVVTECSEEAMQCKKEKHQLGRDFLAFKVVNEKKMQSIKAERDDIVRKLQKDLMTCIEEIDILETNSNNLEKFKKEAKASKRLGEVLNEKLHTKAKEATSLFAENLKLREQAVVVREDLKKRKDINSKQAKQLEESVRAMKLLRSDMTNGGVNGELVAQNHSLMSQLQVLHSKVLVQEEALGETQKDLSFWKDEAESLKKTNKIDRYRRPLVHHNKPKNKQIADLID